MASIGIPLDHNRRPTTDEILRDTLGAEQIARVVACARKGTAIYAAMRDATDPTKVFGVVVLAETSGRGGRRMLYVKAMHEMEGPAASDCPAAILNRLTATDAQYALAWRQRCRERLARVQDAKAVRPGQRLRFAQPLTFNDNVTADTFTYRGGSTFDRPDGQRVRITRWRERAFQVVLEAAA